MLPISPSNPSSADLYSVLHLESLLAEGERERTALVARSMARPTARALGALVWRPIDGLAGRLFQITRRAVRQSDLSARSTTGRVG